MYEIEQITDKYIPLSITSFVGTHEDLILFSINFSKDLAELSDICSRIVADTNDSDFYNINESTVIGLLTKIVKLYKEAIRFYEQNKCEIQALFIRPIYESFIILKYLIRRGETSQKHFRLVSYKSRYDNYKKLITYEYKDSPLIKRQLLKLSDKLKFDGFSLADLEDENKKPKTTKWKVDGKSFWEIHSEVDNKDIYSFIYGGGSDFVHGNWQEIIDFHLTKKGNGFIGFLKYEKSDIRTIVPLNSIILECLDEFLKWNSCFTQSIEISLDKMRLCNSSIYEVYEARFGEPSE